ncbi:MAG: rhodanese-related sulfurtransferase [Planctomycetota bacterium]|jgi:rhodanese-related sulfurtransferase
MSYETLNPPATRERMDAGAWTFIDVRTAEEFEQGHVAGAWNIPFALRDAGGGMAANPDFVTAMKRHFATDAHLVFG